LTGKFGVELPRGFWLEVAMEWNWIRDDEGQDMVEYVLLLGFIVLAGAGTYIALGNNVSGLWTTVNARLNSASN
jgi:Flp pilus assembly pilin Flp